jgi:hypothetical protein
MTMKQKKKRHIFNHKVNWSSWCIFKHWSSQNIFCAKYECVFISFRTGRLERELQIVQLSVSRCSCTAILWVSLVSFAAITLCVVSQRVTPKVGVYFVIDSVRKLLNTPSNVSKWAQLVAWRYIKTVFSFSSAVGKRFVGNALCMSVCSLTQHVRILHFFTLNNVFSKPPEKNTRSQIWRTRNKGTSPSYLTIRKFSVQKGAKMTGKLKR